MMNLQNFFIQGAKARRSGSTLQKIFLSCNKTFIDANSEVIEFLSFFEDVCGQDIMVFICMKCGEKHESILFIK